MNQRWRDQEQEDCLVCGENKAGVEHIFWVATGPECYGTSTLELSI